MEVEKTIESVFREHGESLSNCIFPAWDMWDAHLRTNFSLPSKTLRANVMHGLMVEQARKIFGNNPKAVIIEKDHRFLVELNHSVLIRFKLLDDDLMTRNYPTQLTIDYDRQLDIPGFPKSIRVTAGYQIVKCEDGIRALLVYSKGKEVIWNRELAKSNEASIIAITADENKIAKLTQIKQLPSKRIVTTYHE
jgi:hypothetical protein